MNAIGGDVLLIPESTLTKVFNYFCSQFHRLSSLTHRLKASLQRSEVRGRRLEAREQKTGDRSQQSEIRKQKPDDGSFSIKPFTFRLLPFTFVPLLFALCAMPLPASAATATLAWDPNTAPDIAGYKVHCGTTSGNYMYSVNVGNFTSCTISGLEEGKTYYFSVTAYDSGATESGFADEIAYTIPAASTVYEDAEDGTINGWEMYGDPADVILTNVYDPDKNSRVIQLSGNGFRLRSDDFTGWQNANQFIIEWSMKCTAFFYIFIDVETTAGHRYIYYSPRDQNNLGSKAYVHHGLGSDATDGQWHTFVRDLQADLKDGQPNNQILEVNAFLIRGSGRLDDIMLK